MSFLTRDNNGNTIPNVFRIGTSQVIAAGNTTAASTAFAASTTHVRVACSLGHCYVSFGSAPTATVTTSMLIPANTSEIFAVASGDKIALIKDATVTASTISVTELL
jgi:hypothetical protein